MFTYFLFSKKYYCNQDVHIFFVFYYRNAKFIKPVSSIWRFFL